MTLKKSDKSIVKIQLVVSLFFLNLFLCDKVFASAFTPRSLTNQSEDEITFYTSDSGVKAHLRPGESVELISQKDASRHTNRISNDYTYFEYQDSTGKKQIISLPSHEFEKLLIKPSMPFGRDERSNYIVGRLNDIRKRSDKYLANRVIDNYQDGLNVLNANSNEMLSLNSGSRLFVLSTKKAQSLPNYNYKHIYFYPIDPNKNGEADSSKIYSMPLLNFEAQMAGGSFTNFLKNRWQEEGKISGVILVDSTFSSKYSTKKPKTKASSSQNRAELQIHQYYKVRSNPFPIINRLNGRSSKMNIGDTFYVVYENATPYLVKKGSSVRYTFNDQSLQNAINKNALLNLGPVDFTPKVSKKIEKKAQPSKGSPSEEDFKTPATLSGAISAANQSLNKVGGINRPKDARPCSKNLNDNKSIFDNSCHDKNDYLQKTIEGLVGEAEVYEEHDEKYCILAGLKSTPSYPTFRFANCNGNKLISNRHQPCKTKEFVTFLYKEIKQTSECFKNINFKEILPLMYTESRFNPNAYNLNSNNTLNASGLLQATQVLINSQSMTFSHFDSASHLLKKTKYCRASFEQIKNKKIPPNRNVCLRTDVPEQFRKNLVLAMAQYSRFKDMARHKMESIEAAYPDVDFFDEQSKDEIQTQLARLMHNRGDSKIQTLLEMFFYDLLRGSEAKPNKTKDVAVGSKELDVYDQDGNRVYNPDGSSVIRSFPIIRKHPHGNPNIWQAWGGDDLKAPIGHKEIKNMFSSYVFYEAKRTLIQLPKVNKPKMKVTQQIRRDNRLKYLEPSNSKLEDEGGTFLHKVTCHERKMELDAKELSGNPNITCGHPAPTKDELDQLRLSIGWYKEVCIEDNKSEHSQRLCNAKDPLKARTPAGSMRLSAQYAEELSSNDQMVELCNRDALIGIAARPLAKYYSKDPGKYE